MILLRLHLRRLGKFIFGSTGYDVGLVGWVIVIFFAYSFIYWPLMRTDFSQPWWNWRLLHLNLNNDHHTLDFVAIGATFFGLLALRVHPIFAGFGAWFAVSWGECLWYFFWYLSMYPSISPLRVLVSALLPLEVFTVIFWALAFRYLPKRFMLFIIPYFLAWYLLGFHINIGMNGPTQYYADQATNTTEVVYHWLLGLSFVGLEWKNVREVANKFERWLMNKGLRQ